MPSNDINKMYSLRSKDLTSYDITDSGSDYMKNIYHSSNLYQHHEIDLFNKTYRFGLANPYDALSTTREYLFFTKPDLHIYQRDDETGAISNSLVDGLSDIWFWKDLCSKMPGVIEMLQQSYGNSQDKFNHLLQNQVASNLDIPGLSSEMTDTPTNMYGVGYSYRGTSEASDDNPEFSLEFKDSKWLQVYYFFKAYEEYETLKHHGEIRPYKQYIINRIIHDQFSIYKFLVDDDMETIIYYGKMYGVSPKSLPRDVFSNPTFDNGLSYTIDFKAAFYEDMKPDILRDFNTLSASYYNSLDYEVPVFNSVFDRADTRPAKAAYILADDNSYAPGGKVYKLKWRGSDKI